jgi:hypothetical protein
MGMIVLISFIVLGILISKTGDFVAASGKRFSITSEAQSKIQAAFVSFVGTYQRLPCPADPTGGVNPGWPDGVTPLALPASPTCVFSYGVVPWNALGLSQEQVTDEWGRMISYRVYDGAVGLTQDTGASAVNCDTDNYNAAAKFTTAEVVPTSAGLCSTAGNTHDTLRSKFITYTGAPPYNKGLNANVFGAGVSNIAFVLISHGASGLGGYLPTGARMSMPDADAGDRPNTQTSPGAFVSMAASASGIAPGKTDHFDDVVTYLSIADLLKLANQDARDWPEPLFNPATTANMTTPSVDPTNPHFVTSSAPGQGFTAADGGTAVVAGGGLAYPSASCLWWPLKLDLVSGGLRYLLVATAEFAAVDISSGENFPGFTIGFLSGTSVAGPPTNDTCGTTVAATTTALNTVDPKIISVADVTGILVGMNAYGTAISIGSKVVSISGLSIELDIATTGAVGTVSFADSPRIRRDLGWAGGTLALYTDRFAIEVDSNIDTGAAGPPVVPTANDPSRPHLAVDFGGVTHGTDSNSCVSVGSGLSCDSEIADFPATSKTATGLTGGTTITITDAGGVAGIVHGMSASGVGIAAGAKVIELSGNLVTLSAPNTAGVAGVVTFNSISTSNFMQNGLTVFHSARVEVYPKDCVAPTGTGLIGGTTLTVSSNTGITSGMSAYGLGVASGATVTGVSGTTVTLSTPNLAAVSGTIVFGGSSAVATSASGLSGQNTISVGSPSGITIGMTATGTGVAAGATVLSFSGSTVTLSANNTGDFSGTVTFATASTLIRTLVKTWTLSNAGCNEDPTTCAALKATTVKFTKDVSTNRQAMHAVSCIPASTVANAYDSLYFGITTANRESYGTPATNVKFRSLYLQMPSLP